MPTFDETKQNKKIDFLLGQGQEQLARVLSKKYNIPYIDLSLVSINGDALMLIKEVDAKNANIAAFSLIDKKVFVGCLAPESDKTREQIQDLEDRGYIPIKYIVSEESLKRAWARYQDISHASESKGGVFEISSDDVAQLVKEIDSASKIKEFLNDVSSIKAGFKISKTVEIILAGALATDASDIHLEPEEKNVRLRFRLSGILTDITNIDYQTYHYLLSRVKILSSLKLNIKEAAQDGRFSIKMGEVDIEIRTSTIPGAYGESIVMRVLNPETINVPMENLGMEPDVLAIMEKEIRKPNGMILNTGPTGSGKTTTLYAFLKKVYTSEVKIITIEDPIGYHLAGVVQTQTNREKNYTFAQGLRAALRQDPDIIMVGEIRDQETADIAVNSALTGHLVFSTLHTNTAAGTFPRLSNLGVNPGVMGSAINVAMAQRLIRKLCPNCKKEVPIDEKNKLMIEKIVAGMFNKTKITQTEKMWLPVGCDKCHQSGYKGRAGIFEIILMNEQIDQAIKMGASENEIAIAAKPQGIPTMQEDAVIKILRGDTSIEEVERAINLEGSE